MDWTQDFGDARQHACAAGGGSKGVGSDTTPEDWCDSGLDSLIIGVPLGIETVPDAGRWCEPEGRSGECVSLGGGERLDSAIGDSITDEALGGLSEGLGTMVLADAARSPVGSEKEGLRTEELYNTLSFVSEDGDTALHLALIHEQWSFLHCLMELITLDRSWTPYLDIQNELGQTPLHLAVIVNSSKCVTMLLEAGACAELQERGGNTALHLAVRELRVDCVHALTTCPRTPPHHLTITNYTGVSALHLAVQKGRCDIISMLLKAGADVNQRDQGSGRTPLHWAVESQSCEVVELLVRAGASVDQRSYAGHTPLYCAIYRPNKEVQALLRVAGASTTQDDEDEEDDEDDDDEDEDEGGESEEEEFDDVIINGQRVL